MTPAPSSVKINVTVTLDMTPPPSSGQLTVTLDVTPAPSISQYTFTLDLTPVPFSGKFIVRLDVMFSLQLHLSAASLFLGLT